MRIKSMFKMLMVTILITSLSVISVNAAYEENVSWGDEAYQIIVPGFIEGRDITIDGETVPAIVVEKPKVKSNGKYDFFEIVTTDPDAVMITSSVLTPAYEQVGDYMADLENGSITYSPFLYEDFDEISKEALYLGFSFRDANFKVIYDFPLWVVFDDGEKSTSTTTPTPSQNTTPTTQTTTTVKVKEVTAKSATPQVIINGKKITFYSYNIDGYNYFKLRDLAMALSGSEKEFEVSWDSVNKTINLLPGETYTSDGKELAAPSAKGNVKGVTNQSKIYLDGDEISLEAYNINGNNYFKLKDIANVMNFGLIWDGVKKQIIIDTSSSYTEQ